MRAHDTEAAAAAAPLARRRISARAPTLACARACACALNPPPRARPARSHYDISGRIRKGPAPTNLEVPEYRYLNDEHSQAIIG